MQKQKLSNPVVDLQARHALDAGRGSVISSQNSIASLTHILEGEKESLILPDQPPQVGLQLPYLIVQDLGYLQ